MKKSAVRAMWTALLFIMLSGCFYSPELPPLAEKQAPPDSLLIRNADVFTADPASGFLTGVDILIKDDRIVAIGRVPEPEAPHISIDATGKTVIPGLIDHHVHITSPGAPPWLSVMPNDRMLERNLSAYLYAGVTTVFDMAGPTEELQTLKRRVDSQALANPRFFYAGKALNKAGGHPYGMIKALAPWPVDSLIIGKVMYQIEAPEDIAPAIRENKSFGISLNKIMIDQIPLGVPSLDEELAGSIVDEARREGLETAAHVGSEADLLTGLKAGVPIFAHAPYRSAVSDATIKRMKRQGAVIIPTLVVFEYAADFFEKSLDFTDMDRHVLDPKILAAYENAPENGLGSDDPRINSWVHDLVTYRDIKYENVRKMKREGITIIAGSDSPNVATVPGSSLHTEMRLLVENCGFSPEEALLSATFESGKCIERLTGLKGLGRIAEGGPADLVILNGDFRNDIRQTENIRTVVSDGRIVTRSK